MALGTIADMVPLVGENRILSKTGLELIRAGHRPGLTALLEASAIHDRILNAEDIAFRLAPRLNAAGRMDHAALAVDLLNAQDTEAAKAGSPNPEFAQSQKTRPGKRDPGRHSTVYRQQPVAAPPAISGFVSAGMACRGTRNCSLPVDAQLSPPGGSDIAAGWIG